MKEIHLCGVHHADLRGPERLYKVIDRIKPDFITIEGDKNHYVTMCSVHSNVTTLLKVPVGGRKLVEKVVKSIFSAEQLAGANLDSVIEFYKIMGYECWVPAEYGLRNPIYRIRAIDDIELSDSTTDQIGEEILQNIAEYLRLTPEEFQRRVDEEYLDDESDVVDVAKIVERNHQMVASLVALDKQRILHIGGADHIYSNSPNMYDLLRAQDQTVDRLKLIEADGFRNFNGGVRKWK